MTKSTVLFDDACGKCSRWAAFITRRDARDRLQTVGQATDKGRRLLAERPPALRGVDSVFIITEAGQWHARSAAVWRIAARLGTPWSLGALIWLVPGPVRDLLYDLCARRR